MILGRENELDYLNKIYDKQGSQILVVYGQKNVGKTALLKDFAKNKDSFYYYASDNSERGQLYMMAKACRNENMTLPDYPEAYSVIWDYLIIDNSSKKVIILDGFEHLIKGSDTFMPSLTEKMKQTNGEYLIILCSKAIGFVENDLVSRIGKQALFITGFLKIKELKFSDLRLYFHQYTTEECVILYSILGGIPGLWQYIDKTLSLPENIQNNIIADGCILQKEGDLIVRESLREPAVYYSILSALAEGKNKLNDLYLHTNYSRAKISVYLKNLMEHEIVSKVFSFDTPGRDNQKKGIYTITNRFVRFWFAFLYPNLSALQSLSKESFYEKFISKQLTNYCADTFGEICRETMSFWNDSDQFVDSFERFGYFDGKNGTIDFIGQKDNDDYIVAFANFSTQRISRNELTHYIGVIQSAKIEPSRIYLFTRGGVDEEIAFMAKTKQDLIIIEMQDI